MNLRAAEPGDGPGDLPAGGAGEDDPRDAVPSSPGDRDRALEESENLFGAVFRASPESMAIVSLEDAVIIDVNDRLVRDSGWSRDELIGQPAHTIAFWPNDESRAEFFRTVLQEPSASDVELPMTMRDRSRRTVQASWERVKRDGAPCLLFVFRDITEQRRVEIEREQYFTQSPDLLSVFDAEGRFERLNPAWTARLGYAEPELLGLPVFKLVAHEDRERAIAAALATREGHPIEGLRVRLMARNGDQRWFDWNVTPVTPSGFAYSVARDVTELVEAERQRETLLAELAQRNQVLEMQARLLNRLRLEAEHAATHDSLTGTFDRRAWRHMSTTMSPAAVAIFDIDHFKQVNDRYGHPVGDQVLREVAWRLSALFGVEAVVGRLGGEEFGAIFRSSFEVALSCCEHAVSVMARHPVHVPGAGPVVITMSVGLAPWNPGRVSREDSLDRTYADADRALYSAKRAGRQRLVVAGERSAA